MGRAGLINQRRRFRAKRLEVSRSHPPSQQRAGTAPASSPAAKPSSAMKEGDNYLNYHPGRLPEAPDVDHTPPSALG